MTIIRILTVKFNRTDTLSMPYYYVKYVDRRTRELLNAYTSRAEQSIHDFQTNRLKIPPGYMHLTFSGTRKQNFSVGPNVVAVQMFTRVAVNTTNIVNATEPLAQETGGTCNTDCVKILFLVLEPNKKKKTILVTSFCTRLSRNIGNFDLFSFK